MESVGRVLGRRAASPLEFWVAVAEGQYLQLDDVVSCRHEVSGYQEGAVDVYGLVESVEKLHEGVAFDTDVELVEAGLLPVNTAYVAKVLVTRIEPELFVPPQPGTPVFRAVGVPLHYALYFDGMERKIPAGLMRNGEAAFLNYDFLCGEKGAHINISGISGVATKTSYALFLLYALFHTRELREETSHSHALIFNVKGEDLLYLDQPNRSLKAEHREAYAAMGLPCEPFRSVAFYAPPRDEECLIPDVSRMEGVQSYLWTVRELAELELFRFLFAEAGQSLSQLEFVVERVAAQLKKEAKASPPGELLLEGAPIWSLRQLAEFLEENLESEHWFKSAAPGTRQAFIRRLFASVPHVERLIRSEIEARADHRIQFEARQMTVVDIHRLHPRAKAFVVGAVLNTLFARKEQAATSDPRVYVVLDELNKYAPRTGWNPIKDVLLDIAERGRSMGIVLVGAQQTASEIEERIVGNCAFRVAGRLDAAEGQKAQYGWLVGSFRMRAAIMKPGSMFVHQPEIPCPLMVRFPFPAWATRRQEVDRSASLLQEEAELRKLGL